MHLSLSTQVRQLVSLAAPLALAQLAQSSLPFTHTIFASRLGPEALGGLALGNTLFFLAVTAASGVLFTVNPLVAQVQGDDAARRVAAQGLVVAVLLSLPVGLFFFAAEPVLLGLEQSPGVSRVAAGYLRVFVGAVPAYLALVALRGYLEGVGRARPILYVTLFGVGANVGLAALLMFGIPGTSMPALSLVGAALAGVIVYWVMLGLLWRAAAQGEPRAFLRRPDPGTVRTLFALGLPVALTLLAESGFFAVIALLAGRFGVDALAAHQVAVSCAIYAYNVPLGISSAVAALIGRHMGEGDANGVARAAGLGAALSGAFMLLWGALLSIWPEGVLRLFLDVGDPENASLVSLALMFLRIAAAFQIFDGLQVTLLGALRGLQDTRVPLLLALAAYWGVGLPGGYLLAFPVGFGAAGLWLGLVAGLASAAALLGVRFVALLRRTRRRGVG